jgi:hypothetical protein
MRETSESYARRGRLCATLLRSHMTALSYTPVRIFVAGLVLGPLAPTAVMAQGTTTVPSASQQTCARLLADNPGVAASGPATAADSTRSDTSSFGFGGARSGQADIILWVGVHADQVRFAKQPQTRVRLCWGGDSLRVVQRDNLPSPVVAGTTYRNVFVAVELVGRVNAECLAGVLGVRSSSQTSQPSAAAGSASPASPSNCAFLGGAAGAGAQTPRLPVP